MTTTTIDVTHYGYRVTWSAEDQEFVATCMELSSLPWLAGTQEEALAGLRDLVREVVDDLTASPEPVPEPFATRIYSGKFNPRVGEHLHRHLAMNAAQEHLSLNQYLLRRLSGASETAALRTATLVRRCRDGCVRGRRPRGARSW